MDACSDSPALRVARTGAADREIATTELYDEHFASLVRTARFMLDSPASAEDLVHEAFLKLHANWAKLDDPAKAIGYLRRTVVNLARGRHRRRAIAMRHQPEIRPDERSAEEGAMTRHRRDAVIAALRSLPARQRECIVLRHYLNLSESEIADALDIGVGSVRTHHKRAMAKLSTVLGDLR